MSVEEEEKVAPAQIFIVEDHPTMRRMLKKVIERQPTLTVCGEAETMDEALRRLAGVEPDLVLVDISLRQQNGLELVAQLAAERPSLRTLVLSGEQKAVFVKEAMRRGARGFVTKGNMVTLLAAIHTVLAGGIYERGERNGR